MMLERFLIAAATVFLRLWYHLCRLTGVRRRIVCLSRQSDTPSLDFKLVKDCVERTHPGYRVTILSKTIGNRAAYAFHMFKQVYYVATSRAVLLDSYCIVVSLLGTTIKAPVIQMWHSLGNLKCFGYAALDTVEGHSSETAELMHMHRGYDSVLISSLSFADDYAASFGVDASMLYEAPLPRTDLYLDPVRAERERTAIERAIPQTAERRNIVYCPTYRKRPAANERAAIQALIDCVDFDEYNLIFMRHPVDTLRIDDPRVISRYPDGLDMLFVADYVISDYSTIIYEAGLLGVPVYLYAYDWEEYSSQRRLAVDVEHDVPALFTDDPKAIMAAIGRDEFDAAAFRAFVDKNVEVPQDSTCTDRVVEHVFSLMERTR